MYSEKGNVMNTRRQAFMLAGALTATVFTAAAALAGVSHRPKPSAASPAPTPVVQVAPPAQLQSPPRGEDD